MSKVISKLQISLNKEVKLNDIVNFLENKESINSYSTESFNVTPSSSIDAIKNRNISSDLMIEWITQTYWKIEKKY